MLVTALVQEKAAFKLLQYILLQLMGISPAGLYHIAHLPIHQAGVPLHSVGAKDEQIRLT
jgi:hypothetical protein